MLTKGSRIEVPVRIEPRKAKGRPIFRASKCLIEVEQAEVRAGMGFPGRADQAKSGRESYGSLSCAFTEGEVALRIDAIFRATSLHFPLS